MALPIAIAGGYVRFANSALPTTRALTGTGSFTAPATAIASYEWTIVEKPSGSSASLSSTTAQNPTLNSVDVAGTYLMFLRVTDDNADVSQGDKLLADSSAFVHVRVELPNGLVVPAPSERDYNDMVDEWPVDIDANETAMDAHIADVTDPHNTLSVAGTVVVADAPAGAGEVLVSTGTTGAAWGASSVGDATTGAKGVVLLAEAPISAGSPKAVTRDRKEFTAGPITGSLTALGWEVGHVTVQATTPNNPCHCWWYIEEDTRLKTWDWSFNDGGTIAAGIYSLALVRMSVAQFIAGTVSDVLSATGGAGPLINHAPLSNVGNAINVDLTGGNYIGVLVGGGSTGGGLCVTVHAEKRW